MTDPHPNSFAFIVTAIPKKFNQVPYIYSIYDSTVILSKPEIDGQVYISMEKINHNCMDIFFLLSEAIIVIFPS